MPKIRTETFGSGDQTWLGSDHGIFNAETGPIDISTFTKATHYPDGYIKSGTPVNAANLGVIKPWTAAAGERLAFVLFDMPTDGAADFAAALHWTGRIYTDRLPVAFTAPAAGAQEQFAYATRGA